MDMSDRALNCPFFHDHTAQPSGWFEWWGWVDRMKKTHKQSKCKGCGLWVIWIPKPRKEPTHD